MSNNKLSQLQHALGIARRDLETLTADLPSRQAVFADAQAAVDRLKADKADLSDIAAAQGRLTVAREMLTAHEADIGNTQVRVTQLTRQVADEQFLETLVDKANAAAKRHDRIERTINHLRETVVKGASNLAADIVAERKERADFFAAASQLARYINVIGGAGAAGVPGPQQGQVTDSHRALLKVLQDRGANLSGVLDGQYSGVLAAVDRNGYTAPTDGFSQLIYAAVRLLDSESGRHLPKEKRATVPLLGAPAGPYRL